MKTLLVLFGLGVIAVGVYVRKQYLKSDPWSDVATAQTRIARMRQLGW